MHTDVPEHLSKKQEWRVEIPKRIQQLEYKETTFAHTYWWLKEQGRIKTGNKCMWMESLELEVDQYSERGNYKPNFSGRQMEGICKDIE